MRSRAVVLAVMLALALLSPAVAQEWPLTPARLDLVEREVLTQASGAGTWTSAMSNLPLGPGDSVWVPGQGRTEIQMSPGISVALGDATRLTIRALPVAGARSARISLERGMATVYLTEPQNIVEVELPQGSLRATLPSIFRADVFPDGSVQVSVHAGEVLIETLTGPVLIRNHQTLRLIPGYAPQLNALVPPDEFDRWNDLRDRQRARQASASYLPAALNPYASDLATYGRWIWIPEYGYVWAPTVNPGWSPFQLGRWSWWRGEYVWISDESWGWAPYHYGRWLFYPSVGWIWVPPVAAGIIWSPGAVAWIVGPEFVAWCPLAPGETYYGHRDYGPWSVNITNVQVTNVYVTNVFVNARAPHAVIAVHRDVFLTGRRASVSFLPPKEQFAAGARVTPELPATLRAAKATASPGPSRPTLPLPKRFDREKGFVDSGPPLHGVPIPPPLPARSDARIAPDNGRGSQQPPPSHTSPGMGLPVRTRQLTQGVVPAAPLLPHALPWPSGVGRATLTAPPESMARGNAVLTPTPTAGAREVRPMPAQRGTAQRENNTVPAPMGAQGAVTTIRLPATPAGH